MLHAGSKTPPAGDTPMKKQHAASPKSAEHSHSGTVHYGHLALMAVLSFVSMYALMYAMVNAFGNVYLNVNQFYMAGLMTAPMVIIEIAVMGGMYRHKKAKAAIFAASVVALVGFWLLIRYQGAVSDKQFLRSMIPHHAGALLMCEEASITDPDVKRLCESIKVSQRAEIDLMKAKLKELAAR
jgi:uncharacterized protein (DUF305 family)